MKTVLVTGGSSGIGAAACRLAAGRSWAVHVGYGEGADRARAVADEITGAGGKAWALRVALEDPQGMAAALASISASSGRLDALVLCASPAPVLGSFLKTDAQGLQEQFRINAIGNQALIAAAWKLFFSKQEAGHVVAVLSQFAEGLPKPQMTSYVVGKRALLAVLECALQELGSSGLRASVVIPGYTDTPMLRALHPHILEAARATQIGSKFLSEEQVAQTILQSLEQVPPTPDIARYPISNDRK